MFSLCTAIGIAVDITASHVLALALTRGELAGYAHGRIVHWPVWVDAKTLIASICQWMHHTNNCSLHFDNVSQTIGGSYYASLTYNIGEILNYRQYDLTFVCGDLAEVPAAFGWPLVGCGGLFLLHVGLLLTHDIQNNLLHDNTIRDSIFGADGNTVFIWSDSVTAAILSVVGRWNHSVAMAVESGPLKTSLNFGSAKSAIQHST